MTIALLIKVNDGLVLASDSASTIMGVPSNAATVENIYNSANKIFNLHKQLPIGAMTWGLGNIGPSSISTIAKDLRRRFQTAADPWSIDPDSYDIDTLASRAREFVFDDRYLPVVQATQPSGTIPPLLGFLVAGYSSSADEPTARVMYLGGGLAPDVQDILDGQSGAMWWGQPEAISRILNGYSLDAPQALADLGIGLDAAQATNLFGQIGVRIAPQMINPAMPIQDAIDLAEFLVHATIQYVRFSPGHPTVGGPIEIATLTKHEGFKWVQRKHYFDNRLNPSS